MSFENDILRLLLLENYMSSAKSDSNSESKVRLEIKSRDCDSVTIGGKTYATRKFWNKIWMIDNLDLPYVFGADNATQKIHEIQYYTWNNAIDILSRLPGWHLPSVEEWRDLDEYRTHLGSDLFRSEFNLLPTGYIDSDGTLFGVSDFACFWTSTKIEGDANGAYFDLVDGQFAICSYHIKSIGRCIRLVKDD